MKAGTVFLCWLIYNRHSINICGLIDEFIMWNMDLNVFGKEHVVLVIIVNFKVLGMVLSDVCVYKYVYTFLCIYVCKFI